jgi:hypothetical protein
MRRLRSAAIALSLVAAAARPARAAQGSGPFRGPAPVTPVVVGEAEPKYGTTSRTAFTIGAVNFTPRLSTTPYFSGPGIERYVTTAGAALVASPMLPNGARVERVEIRACDMDPTAEVALIVGPCPVAGDLCEGAAMVATGVLANSGCNNYATNLAVPFVVDNENTPILAYVTTGTTQATMFSAVKIYYRLQVSPAPLFATFPLDVPTTHPFFRFIEALAASGITSGCAPGFYCPDQPVTRGQLAVFLAAALGLHFPN